MVDSAMNVKDSRPMGRKRGEKTSTMIRVYTDFADQVRQAAGERGMTVGEFLERFAGPSVAKAHKDYIRAEAKKLAGEE
jgi:hypothetical protein